jgi:hypothetical protein
MAEAQAIYFDSTYRLRVVEEEKFKDTERLQEECGSFTSSACRLPAGPWILLRLITFTLFSNNTIILKILVICFALVFAEKMIQ